MGHDPSLWTTLYVECLTVPLEYSMLILSTLNGEFSKYFEGCLPVALFISNCVAKQALIQKEIKVGGWLRFQDGAFIEHYYSQRNAGLAYIVCEVLSLCPC